MQNTPYANSFKCAAIFHQQVSEYVSGYVQEMPQLS